MFLIEANLILANEHLVELKRADYVAGVYVCLLADLGDGQRDRFACDLVFHEEPKQMISPIPPVRQQPQVRQRLFWAANVSFNFTQFIR